MKIVCAIDGSPGSEKTVQALAEHSWPAGTVVRVLSVVEKVHPSVLELATTGESPAEAQRSLDLRCGEIAEAAARKLEAAGVRCEPVMREGNPKNVIVDEARRWGANLIVVGHKGHRSGVARLLLGSVAQSVVAHAHCSVMVIRREEGAEQERE